MLKLAVKYSESKNVLLTIIVSMLVLFAFILFTLFSLDKLKLNNENETIILFSAIIFGSLLVIVSILMMIKTKGDITHTTNGIEINLEKTTFLYKQKNQFIEFVNMSNIYLDEDSYHRKVISIKTKQPSKTILIEPRTLDDNARFETYWNELNSSISTYNTKSIITHEIIERKSMYSQWWAKALAIISAIVAIGMIILKIINNESVPTWRLLFYLAYVFPFCFLVYSAIKKSSKQNNER